jgi:spoIIIJ-associated protein
VETFLKGLLERMDSDAVPHAFRKDAETIGVELEGQELGALIGRRGETLDAIQHLANYALNHDASKRTRVTVDAENYRGKREESLRHLARKMAAKVVKYRRNMTLEPMNAYERHVIHATLQDVPNVTTYSTGTEPNRRVVVAYEKNN